MDRTASQGLKYGSLAALGVLAYRAYSDYEVCSGVRIKTSSNR
jgi:uncharacterized membrane protein YebE (DUF533 family)